MNGSHHPSGIHEHRSRKQNQGIEFANFASNVQEHGERDPELSDEPGNILCVFPGP